MTSDFRNTLAAEVDLFRRPTPPNVAAYLLGRPLTADEGPRLSRLALAANTLLREKVGPVPPETYPAPAWTWAVVRIAVRVLENGGALEVLDWDLRHLAAHAAEYRPVHPFNLA